MVVPAGLLNARIKAGYATTVGAVSGNIVRRAGTRDIGAVGESSAALFAEDAAAHDPLRNQDWPAQHGEQWCADLLNDRNALVLVAEVDNDVVGHLIGSFSDTSAMRVGPRAELVSMHVAPAHRGRGVGSRLVEEFREWARERGAVRLLVTAYVGNERALRFYAMHGSGRLSVELAASP
jgi:GNAT superfamily N-acetyltransferase